MQPFAVFRASSLVVALGAITAVIAACGSGGGDQTTAGSSPSSNGGPPSFSDPTNVDNPYFPITERRRCRLRGEERGDRIDITRTLLERTEPFTIAGSTVEAAVVEDREYENGKIVERVHDYFAQGDDGAVYYLGKDVDNYEGGKVANHEGQFRYGRDTDTLGVAMPADPQVGDLWRAEVVAGSGTRVIRMVEEVPQAQVQGKAYDSLIRVRERELPRGDREFKLYAPGAGIVRELPPGGRIELISCA